MRPTLRIALGQYSTAGRKPENQDFHGALEPDGAALATKGIAVALADGISTSRQGAAAAETAVKSFLTDYYCTSDAWSVRTAGERVIAATNSWMHATNGRVLDDRERESGMICTFSAMVLKSRSAHLFHVGDARIARAAGRSFEPLTQPHRVYIGGGESFLGRALGVNRSVEIDYFHTDLQPGDLFMLSTDGVHEHVGDGEAAALVAAAPDLDEAARALCEAALAAGSPDNLTVQLVRVESLPEGDIGDLIGAEADLPPAPRLRPGTDFAGYEILDELHSGSRSHVYLARDRIDGRQVAIKVPATEQAQDAIQMQALLLEEWVMRRLQHPNLLKPAPQRGPRRHVFSVSDFIPGQPLSRWMQDRPRPGPGAGLDEVRALVRQIAAGLQALHRRQMLHRDLGPHNVLVGPDGTPRIIDYGSVQVAGLDELALRLDDAAFAGTLQYSAPELYLGRPASRQSDLYSLGVIAYQLLTGALPYGPTVAAGRTRAALRRLRYTPAGEHNPDVPDWMDAALAKAVAIDPSKRYEELSEFIADLAAPNPTLSGFDRRPLLQRSRMRLSQLVDGLLALADRRRAGR